jgi:hypothetical protein
MRSSDWNLPRLLTLSALALLCFCVGYLAPHRSVALAQTPSPRASVDDVPGGGGLHGAVRVTNAMGTGSAELKAAKSGWACSPKSQCFVSIRFRVTQSGASPPATFTCPRSLGTCFTFESFTPNPTGGTKPTGTGFDYAQEYPDGGNPTPKYSNVQITGMLQLQAR